MADRRVNESNHLGCTEHSGLNVKVNLILSLTGFATLLLGVLLTLMISLKGDTGERFATIEGRIIAVEQRLVQLEGTK